MEPPPSGAAMGGATTSASTPSKVRTSKNASAAQVPNASVSPPDEEGAPASTPTASVDGTMEDRQQVLDESPTRMAATPFWIPQMSMTFSSLDEAWQSWVTYGGRMGFDKDSAKKNGTKKNTSKKKKTSKPVQHEESGSLAPDSAQSYERNRYSTLEEYQGHESLNSFSQLLMSSSVVEDVSSIRSFGGMDGWYF
ncbi:unnamed protein product [Urochloa decumbens]|uniref:Uncharacterized protein n=1 Tax=Urochloa decumbens TaxID=240449 RepID=A0ABC9ADT9_9POAL